MPTYDYECTNCGHSFDIFQNMSDDPLKECPACEQSALKRLIGGGAGIIFKGSGFYVNDSRGKSGSTSSESSSKESSSKESGSKESAGSNETGSSDGKSSGSDGNKSNAGNGGSAESGGTKSTKSDAPVNSS